MSFDHFLITSLPFPKLPAQNLQIRHFQAPSLRWLSNIDTTWQPPKSMLELPMAKCAFLHLDKAEQKVPSDLSVVCDCPMFFRVKHLYLPSTICLSFWAYLFLLILSCESRRCPDTTAIPLLYHKRGEWNLLSIIIATLDMHEIRPRWWPALHHVCGVGRVVRIWKCWQRWRCTSRVLMWVVVSRSTFIRVGNERNNSSRGKVTHVWLAAVAAATMFIFFTFLP